MHETSDGENCGITQPEQLKTSEKSDENVQVQGVEVKMITNLRALRKINSYDEDSVSNQRIYDDPCELLEGSPIYRLTRSRSWFCCSNRDRICDPVHSADLFNRCDYSLVTEAPKIQFNAV